ncbi:plastid lipid-associated PAP/fibrillin family protein [Nitzschia inconspicua]|uniref:Plastid lipid-associated PAP/fibrillin family protein n=1 Tax=Nitzschia inconspicua TaxID=303405 RepID=A0A9K3PH42_9STRA|nr:plastid lipid-associated PAP/fibrillin family protein [Nitzschia inconspicua]
MRKRIFTNAISSSVLAVIFSDDIVSTSAFGLGKVLSRFSSPGNTIIGTESPFPTFFNDNRKTSQVEAAKNELLQTISSTKNGKESSLETQKQVLSLVDFLETQAPTSPTLLTDPMESMKIDGLWYLQYTQPSDLGLEVDDIPTWKPATSSLDVVSKLDTRQANNQGTVSFLGTVAVDTSDRLTTQTIDIAQSRVTNFVEQNLFTVEVAGSYELDTVPNRVIVSFDKCDITIKNTGLVLDLSFLFDLRSFLKGGLKAGGWLETTYIDDDIRIGRGNRGSLFVLTRDKGAVSP